MNKTVFCTKCGKRLDKNTLSELCGRCSKDLAAAVFFPVLEIDSPTVIAAALHDDPTPLPDGMISYIGNYKLQRLLGKGGMGEVYLARQLNLDRHVAVKVLRQNLSEDKEVKQRFEREARLASQLGPHPNIVPVYEPGEHKGRSFFSMEFIDGKNLAEVLRDGPIPPKDAARYMAAVAGAIHLAHSKGVIHRDVKPANVLIDVFGTPRLTDFGMAKDFLSKSEITKTHQIVGTINYMSPEQIDPKFGEVGPGSDVYSLGATLYQLLTGSPPFTADSPANILQLVTDQEPILIKKYNPKLPTDLQTICQKCLQKEPKQRYATALELASDLTRFLEDKPIKAIPPDVFVRTAKWSRRNPGWAASLGVVLITLASAFMAMTWHNYKLKEKTWMSLLSEAQAHLSAKNRQRALKTLKEAAKIKKDAITRRQAIDTITEPGVSFLRTIDFSSAHQVAFSSDNRLIAVAGNNTVWYTNLYLKDKTIPIPGNTNEPNVVGMESGMAAVWDISTGKIINSSPYALSGSIAWSPKGNFLAVPHSNNVVAFWDPIVNKEKLFSNAGGKCLFSPDGIYLVTAETSNIKVFEVNSAALRAHRNSGVAISFATESVLLILETNRIVAWNVVSGAEEIVGTDRDQLLRVSDDGLALVRNYTTNSPSRLKTIRTLKLYPHKIERFLPLEGHSRVSALNYDGTLLSVEDPGSDIRVKIWSTKAGRFLFDLREDIIRKRGIGRSSFSGPPIRRALSEPERTYFPGDVVPKLSAFSPNSRFFASEALDPDGESSVSVWTLQNGEKLINLQSSQMPVWSEDSSLLAVRGGTWAQTHSSPLQLFKVYGGVARYQLSTPIQHLFFSRNGRLLSANNHTYEIKSNSGLSAVQLHWPKDSVLRYFDFALDWEIFQGSRGVILRKLRPNSEEVAIPTPFEKTAVISYNQRHDGRRLAVFLWSMENDREVPGAVFSDSVQKRTEVQIWDMDSLRTVTRWSEDDKSLILVRGSSTSAFSPNGRWFASVVFFTGKIYIRDAETGKVWKTLEIAAVPGDKANSDTNTMKIEMDYRKIVTRLVFSRDSKSLIFAQGSKVVIAEVATGKIKKISDGHRGSIQSLNVSENGRILVSGDETGSIHLWELPTGRELASWQAYSSHATALAFGSNDQILASGSSYGTIKLWDIPYIKQELEKLGLDW